SGVDTPAYIAYFRGDELTPRQFEIGFALFTQVFRVFGSAEWYIWGIAMVQVLSMALAARLLGIRNLAVVLIAYIAFLPGLDMLTNGMRNGLALTLGMPILIATTINRASMRLFNFLPAT